MDPILSYHLLRALSINELLLIFWYSLLLDVPRYFLSCTVYAFIPHRVPDPPEVDLPISAIVACHNEEEHLRECVESLKCVKEVIVVNDGSTDKTEDVIIDLMMEGKVHKCVNLHERTSKPNAVNEGLKYVTHPWILVLDSDTAILDDSAARRAAAYLSEDSSVGGVSFNIRIRNVDETLITRHQAIEYAVSIGLGKRIADSFNILTTVSGAAGLFRREALIDVGGFDIEVAEDAAVSMKLRAKGWKLRFAPDAYVLTRAPENIISLLMQRLRWDTAMVGIWWRKFSCNINPFSRNFDANNLLASLDVVGFSILLPMVLPVYILWLVNYTDGFAPLVLTTVFMGLTLMEMFIVFLSGASKKLLLYVPFYIIVQNLIMRPARTIFVITEMVALLTKRDNYIPKQQRHKLS